MVQILHQSDGILQAGTAACFQNRLIFYNGVLIPNTLLLFEQGGHFFRRGKPTCICYCVVNHLPKGGDQAFHALEPALLLGVGPHLINGLPYGVSDSRKIQKYAFIAVIRRVVKTAHGHFQHHRRA